MNNDVRIVELAKNSMQSATIKKRGWVLMVKPQPSFKDPLMGWHASKDPFYGHHLFFKTKEAACFYAKKKGYTYRVEVATPPALKNKKYEHNFQNNFRAH